MGDAVLLGLSVPLLDRDELVFPLAGSVIVASPVLSFLPESAVNVTASTLRARKRTRRGRSNLAIAQLFRAAFWYRCRAHDLGSWGDAPRGACAGSLCRELRRSHRHPSQTSPKIANVHESLRSASSLTHASKVSMRSSSTFMSRTAKDGFIPPGRRYPSRALHSSPLPLAARRISDSRCFCCLFMPIHISILRPVRRIQCRSIGRELFRSSCRRVLRCCL